MKTKLLFSTIQNFKNGIKLNGFFTLLIIFFMTVTSFGQGETITFGFCGETLVFSSDAERDINGFPNWSPSIDDLNDPNFVPVWTLYVENDGGVLTWALREPGTVTDSPTTFYTPGPSYLTLPVGNGEFCDVDNWGPGAFDLKAFCAVSIICTLDSDSDSDGYNTIIDCDDSDSNIYPGASEQCDGLDNNCNGMVDEELTDCNNDPDSDGDGVPDNTDNCVDTANTDQADLDDDGIGDVCDDDIDGDGVPAIADCDDEDDQVGLATVWYLDADGDGYAISTISECDSPGEDFTSTELPLGDCDDNDIAVNPGASEVTYDGKDNDCNPATLDDDLDQDGYVNADDCDDQEGTVYPGIPGDTDFPPAEEICDGLDNDCNGQIDEGIEDCTNGVIIEYCNDAKTKILVCHNGKDICVSINAMPAHEAHDDYIGSCANARLSEGIVETPTSYDVVSWPNPTNDLFNVRMITPNYEDKVNLQAFDINGRLVHSKIINGNEDYQFGTNLHSGIYFVKISQASTTEVIKVIKR